MITRRYLFVCCEILCKQGFDIRLEGDKFSLAKGDGACKKRKSRMQLIQYKLNVF